MRKILLLLLVICFAMSTIATQLTSPTRANPTIPEPIPMKQAYIKSNGDVDPATLPIERSGNTYVLKNNIVNTTIEIQKDNIVLDGNGHSLTLSPSTELWWETKTSPPCIVISNKNNITVKNVSFQNGFRAPEYFTAISIKNSTNIVLLQNIIEKYGNGIQITASTSCSIIGNILTDNFESGFRIENSTHIYIAYNNISRAYYAHFGGKVANIDFSIITRNNISSFDLVGIRVAGNNAENQIYENNFIKNSIGLMYDGYLGNFRMENISSAKNAVYNNYWNNNRQVIIRFFNSTAVDISEIDQSPLTGLISTSFDSSLFPLAVKPEQTFTPISQSNSEPFPTVPVAVASGATVAIVVVSLIFYYKRRKH